MELNVTIKGPLFDKRIDRSVKQAIVEECMAKLGPRMQRGGKGLGSQRNTVTTNLDDDGLRLTASTSRVFPRTTGRSWQGKNVAIVRAMAPNVLRSTARRIVSELS